MIRYIISANSLLLYIIYLAGKVEPHQLKPVDGALGYLSLFGLGVSTVFSIIAVLRWKGLDA